MYDRLLATPTQGYTTHFDKYVEKSLKVFARARKIFKQNSADSTNFFLCFSFQEHVSSNPPQTILPVDDFLEIRREVLQMLKQYDTPSAAVAAGEEAPPGAEIDDGASQEKGQAIEAKATVSFK